MTDEQEFFDNIHEAVKAKRKQTFEQSRQISLGELIAEMEKVVQKEKIRISDPECSFKEEAEVYFDFGHMFPSGMSSWRGIYAELAICYDERSQKVNPYKASEFLKELKNALGSEFTGWKGGEFTMHEDTPLWVANPGYSDHTGIVGVLYEDYGNIIILTEYQRNF